MEALIKVIKKDPQIRIKINDMLERHMKLPYNCRSKIGYDFLNHNVILK